jgi:hypothetical protein
VATPTKVSSYMAAGVIPIMTTAVGDYALRLGSMKNMVMNSDLNAAAIAAKVLEFEAQSVSPPDILAEYRQVFSDYFDHNKYVPEMANFLRSTGLN